MSLKEIKISLDGQKLNFHFANGSTSPTFYSKEASFKYLFEKNLNSNIEIEDYERIKCEIANFKDMPMTETDHERVYHLLLPLREAGIINEEDYKTIKQKMKIKLI